MRDIEIIEKYGTTHQIEGFFFLCHPAGSVMIRFSTIHHYQWDDDKNQIMITLDSGKHLLITNLAYRQVKHFQDSYIHWLLKETGNDPSVINELKATMIELIRENEALKKENRKKTITSNQRGNNEQTT